MGLASTLQGHRVTAARVNIPAWGRWFAEPSVDGDHTITGRVETLIADLKLSGTILSGGAFQGRSGFRIVAGAAGWGKELPEKSYANDAGVKVSTVLEDAARETGETIVATTTDKLPAAWVRPRGPAYRLLELVAPAAWYVDELGTTRLGKRAASKLPAGVTVQHIDRANAKVELASDAIAAILPGVVVEGITAVDVVHELTKTGIRTTLYGQQGALLSRRLSAFKTIMDQLDPARAFRGVFEYRVVTLEGDRVNLQPVRVSTGMPDLRRVNVRPGVAGCKSTFKLGARVIVGFVDGSAGRPYVCGVEEYEGEGFQATTLEIDAVTAVKLGAGLLPVARSTDMAGIYPITTSQTKVKA